MQRRKHLLADVQNWQTANNIRAYVAEVTKLIEDAGLEAAKGGDLDPIATWRDEIRKAVINIKGASASTPGSRWRKRRAS